MFSRRFLRRILQELILKLWKELVQKKRHNHHGSVFKVLREFSYYFNINDPLIIALIFIFLSCCEKAHVKKEFSRENLKTCHESQIMTC